MSTSPSDGISKLSVEDTSNDDAPPVNIASSAETASGTHSSVGRGDNAGQAVIAEGTPSSPAPNTTAPLPSRDKPQRTVCGVCEKETSKYKCPHCPLAYCSVSCSRVHKQAHPPASLPPKPPPPISKARAPKPEPSHPFSVLDNSPELRTLFRKYPNLPQTLENIHTATLPPKKDPATRGGLPWKLSDVDSRILDGTGRHGGGKRNEPWSQDVGLSRGRDALRKARMDPSADGDGVREYCELVLYLLSKVDGGDEVTAKVNREYTREEMKFIETLQRQENQD